MERYGKRAEDFRGMTIMIIDNKATAEKSLEAYTVDRDIHKTKEDLIVGAYEFMNDDVYLIRVFEDGEELFTMRNWR